MNLPLPLLLPLASALLYVVGALLLKRSNGFGVGVWRTTFVSNLVTAFFFLLLLPFGGSIYPERWWEPAIVGLFFILGQVFMFLAFQRGDVTIATPVLGLKIIFVALFTSLLLAQTVPPILWLAALLSSLAIGLLNRVEIPYHHHHVRMTIILAASSAAMFALFDVLVQKWAPAWGAGRFLPVMMGCVAAFSFLLLPMFPGPLRAVPRAAWPWLMAGCIALGAQAILFVTTIAHFGNATAANVIYSSRGLWSVVVVWLFGHWFGNREHHHGARVLRWRMAGAALMTAAIVMAVLR